MIQVSLAFALTVALTQGVSASVLPPHYEATVRHHQLAVELIPEKHELVAEDRIELTLDPHAASVTCTLAPTLQVESVVAGVPLASGEGTKAGETLRFTRVQPVDPAVQHIVVELPKGHGTQVTLVWTYRGVMNDPPREPRHLRFVTPSETAGHIGPEGVYLSSESQWYPDIAGSLSTYRMTAKVPQGWTVVAPGHREPETTKDGKHSTTWIVREPSEALTVVANKFVTKSRAWTGPTGQHVELLTHFFPDNALLADEYLEATAKYLAAYVRILGDYPFERFAVVENFFASGLGMPSFTLLGSGSIKRHYVQPYALGHEIVHSWIGNSVFNRDDAGNWVEGLTTYLANYYWHELTHDDRQALEQRRMMLHGYSLYVSPEDDYPVSHFLRKHDEKDNAIGYQKSAFVFHLLRREIGDEAFWRSLKTFVSRYRNQPADWQAIEQVCAQESGRNLRWFFEQWVERPGAPILSLGETRADLVKNASGTKTWHVTVRVEQNGKPFKMAVPVRITTQASTEVKSVSLNQSPATIAEFEISSQPIRVELDPEMMVFRRFARHQLPPMLNGYVTDPLKTVVRAFSDPASPLQNLVDHIADPELPASRKASVRALSDDALPRDGSVLVLAGAEQRQAVQLLVQESCREKVALSQSGFQIDGEAYEGQKNAVLFSCHRAQVPGSVLTVLYGVSADAVSRVSRLLFYYGWHSYVIFQDGAVVKRELWQGSQEVKEVRTDER